MEPAGLSYSEMGGASTCRYMALIVLAFVPVTCSACSGSDVGPGAQNLSIVPLPPLSPDRLNNLQRAIASARSDETLQRAMKESAPYLGEYPALAEAILTGSAWNGHGDTRAQIHFCLWQARGQAVQAIVGFYRDAPAEKRWILRAVLCRSGMDARAAAPLLRAELQKAETSSEDKMAIRVVLAGLGQTGPAELDELTEAISASREAANQVLGTMVECGYNPWVPENMESAIIKLLEKPRLTPDNLQQAIRDSARLALTTLGERTDAHVLNALDTEYNSALTDPRCPPSLKLCCGLCVAKTDARRRRPMMLSLLEEVPGSLLAWQVRPLMEWMCAGMPDDDLLWVANALLSTRKAERLDAALVILYAIGPRARSAVPRLVMLVRSAEDDSTRTAAAEALGMLADPSDLALLKRLSADVASQEEIKHAVDESIRAIQLED